MSRYGRFIRKISARIRGRVVLFFFCRRVFTNRVRKSGFTELRESGCLRSDVYCWSGFSSESKLGFLLLWFSFRSFLIKLLFFCLIVSHIKYVSKRISSRIYYYKKRIEKKKSLILHSYLYEYFTEILSSIRIFGFQIFIRFKDNPDLRRITSVYWNWIFTAFNYYSWCIVFIRCGSHWIPIFFFFF